MQSTMTVRQISAIIVQHMDVLRDSYRVKTLGVFGSVARGEETEASDVDVLVEFTEPISFFKFIDLEEYLSRILGRKVELVTKNALKPSIKDAVLRDVVYV